MQNVNWDDLPIALEPKHVQQILQIGQRQTYELLNQEPKPFHYVRVGRLIKISKDVFRRWLDGEEATAKGA